MSGPKQNDACLKALARLPECQGRAPFDISPAKPWLAPLAGYSDLPFRLLCREFGASITVTEMISAKGLMYSNPATARLLANHSSDQPLVVQLFGNEPDVLYDAIKALRQKGFNIFDFNAGCPVRKVFKQKSGASLLDDQARLLQIAKAIIQALKEELPGLPPGKAGFKLRAGTRPEKPVLPDLACRLEDCGADWITVHPRFASQGYSGLADWKLTENCARRLKIPVIASGDLLSAKKGLECMSQTGARTVMYARGALYNPAIFHHHLNLFHRKEPAEDIPIAGIIRSHLRLSKEHGAGPQAFRKMRSLIPRYVRGMPGANDIRKEVCQCAGWEDLEKLVNTLNN